MRFNPEDTDITAAHLLNTASQDALGRVFQEYGEEPGARRLAREIVQTRRQAPFRTTRQLVDLAQRVLGARGRRGRLHPATRIFQALRIAVNRELEELESFLKGAPEWLAPGGRLVILSYHSLEDRLVKHSLLAWEKSGSLRRLTRKPLTPTLEEQRHNPRARSAKLRLAERTTFT
jgi:16S rRNA (cytosine1402-N4)-methyltransferase